MLETVTASHLVRLSSLLLGKRSTFDPHNHVFYWRGSKSREVDFVLYDGDQIKLPIEVKRGSRVDARDLGGLTQFASGAGIWGLVLSRDTIDERNNYLVIPASAFLALV